MQNRSNGLRFDVYERVHLPENLAAIDELDEIELVPRIQAEQSGQQVMLRGHLLLSGVYRSHNDTETAQLLEHRIPVEITLPMNRVNRLDDIFVEIDNFDVDLLSARTLNITGVLSLYGIELEHSQERENWRREEPFTVVHARESDTTENPAAWSPTDVQKYAQFPQLNEGNETFQQWEKEAQEEPPLNEAAQCETTARETAFQEAESCNPAKREVWMQETPVPTAEVRETQWQDATVREASYRENEERESLGYETASDASWREAALRDGDDTLNTEPDRWELAYQDSELQPFGIAHSSPIQSEVPFTEANISYGDITVTESDQSKKEMRVALGSKPTQAAPPPAESAIGLRSLLQSSIREQEARAAAEKSAKRAAEEEAKSAGDEIEWKNLFLGNGNEESFRKVRMCIVQREETLEMIAGRYHLQPREIALYNRLIDQNVTEGQVLYIP